jgi:hypothetical protein
MSFIKPEIYKGLVREKFDSKIKVSALATNLGEIEGFRSVGETIVFPKWSLIGDVEEMVKGDSMTPEELAQTSTTASIKMVGKAVKVYDIEDLTALGSQVDESATQTALKMARKLDADLVVEALTSSLVSPTVAGKEITEEELDTANVLFGDEIDVDEFAGIVVHSYLVPSFYKMDSFVNAGNTTSADANGIVRNGLLGYFRGIPVYVANSGTYDQAKDECVTFIIKKNALGYKMKRDLNVETQRNILDKSTDVASDMIYAVKLLADDGVVVVRKTTV